MRTGIRGDVEGRVPFSLVAVIALLLAGMSSAYLAETSRDAARAELQLQQLAALRTVAVATNHGVELEARALALEAIRVASEGPPTTDRINREFARLLHERLETSFPRTIRGFTIELDRVSATLFLERFQTLDLVPAPPIRETGVDWTAESLVTDVPGVLGETTRTPYFTLVGSANYTITKEGMTLTAGLPLRAAVDSPFPMLQSAVREFRGAADGSESELTRIVRYVLTTAAQFRALQGYAAGEFGEPGTTTLDILTHRDVEVAVNLALLLEELRRFRDVDDRSLAAFDDAFFSAMAGSHTGESLVPDVSQRIIARLFESYARGGTTDPADLFALYSAVDAEPVRLNRVLAQALSAVVDQEVLRVFTYYGIEWVLDFAVEGEEILARSIDEFLGWLEGGAREAEAVRAYIRELFRMAAEPTTFLGTYPLAMPAREYNAADEDGSVHMITIPAHTAPIEFDTVDLLSGHDDLWRSYYAALYRQDMKVVHASAREFLTDLATNVANNLELIGAIPNPSLRERIDPKDSESILDFVRNALTTEIDAAIVRLRSDPSYLGALVTNLWRAQADSVRHLLDFLRANYGTLSDEGAEIAIARSRLAMHLASLAPSDPDYGSLDLAGLADLWGHIERDADGDWVPVAYGLAATRDSDRLQRIYASAMDAATPPEGGGIYQGLLDTVLSATGFLEQAGDLMRAFGRALAAGDDLHNGRILVPTPDGPFEFWTGNRTSAVDRHAVRTERIAVRQSPSVLRITRDGGSERWNPGSLEEGDLWVDLRDPSTVERSRNSPNVHWTDIRKMSERPFETRWDLRVLGLVRVDVLSARGVRLGAGGHVPEVASTEVPIDFYLNITVYSGWPLEGVAYKDSTTFAREVWAQVQEILGEFWRQVLEPAVDWVLDEVHAFIEILVDLIRRVMESEIVRALAEVVRVTVDALQDYALEHLGPLAPIVELLVNEVRDGDVSFDSLGLNFTLSLGPTPASVKLTGWKDDVEFYVALILKGFNRHEPISVKNAPVNLRFGFTYYADDLTLTLEGDVLAIAGGQLVKVRAVPKDRGWVLELTVPAIDAYRVFTPWWFQLPPIPTPLGPLTIELGVEIRYRLKTSVDWAGLLAKTIAEAIQVVGGIPADWDEFGLLLRTFADRLIMNLADIFLSGLIELKEFVLYLEGVFGAGDAAGGGFRVAFVLDGRAVIEVLRWLVHNLIRFMRNFPVLSTDVEYEAFPSDLLDYFSVRIEAFGTVGLPRFMAQAGGEDVPARVRAYVRVQPNLPALLNGWRPEAGTWRVDFGVYLEQVPAPVADAFFGTGTATPDVWFLKGAVVETAP